MSYKQFDLTIMTCEACHSGAPRMEEAEVAEFLPQVPAWEVVEINSVPRLRRTFTFKGWLPAVEFVRHLATAAEENDHHPQIRLEWGKVQVNWWTHKIRGLHKNDFIMAAKTDTIWKSQT